MSSRLAGLNLMALLSLSIPYVSIQSIQTPIPLSSQHLLFIVYITELFTVYLRKFHTHESNGGK